MSCLLFQWFDRLLFDRLLEDEAGQGMVEYLLVVSLVVVMVAGIFGAFVHHFR